MEEVIGNDILSVEIFICLGSYLITYLNLGYVGDGDIIGIGINVLEVGEGNVAVLTD